MIPQAEYDALTSFLQRLPVSLPEKPKAVLVISAHWEAPVPTLQTAARPPLLFDYSGFPPATYELKWPAPGAPELASRVRTLVGESAIDAERGYDHGAFVPLMVAWPQHDVPTLQLSLIAGLDPQRHLELGRALQPLRDEGVLIVGSGMSFHNMRGFGTTEGHATSEVFDDWLRNAALAPRVVRERALTDWVHAPAARVAHPREEHLLPLHVVVGAAGDDQGAHVFSGSFGGARISAFRYG
jgi:aromatic ring-opening dioxygenase catalytic subunit (LigB family)